MADRTRPIRIEVCVTKQESNLIRHKMAQLGTRNMSTYFHKMDIDGYIIKVDYTQQKKRPQPSVGLPPISIRYAAVSTAQGIFTRTIFQN